MLFVMVVSVCMLSWFCVLSVNRIVMVLFCFGLVLMIIVWWVVLLLVVNVFVLGSSVVLVSVVDSFRKVWWDVIGWVMVGV